MTSKESARHGNRIVVDPVTRIEGHLRIEVEVEDGNQQTPSSSGTMFRGFEIILNGRDPRDAWAFTRAHLRRLHHGACAGLGARRRGRARHCGSAERRADPQHHALRTLYVQDHVVHFYHLHALDWVDVVSALKADPKKTSELAQSISNWPKNSPGYFSDRSERLKKFVEQRAARHFANGYWGHPAYKLPPEANLMAWRTTSRRSIGRRRSSRSRPSSAARTRTRITWSAAFPARSMSTRSRAINMERLNIVAADYDQADEFVNHVYIPDLLAVASFYKDWAAMGGGLQNFLSYGECPTRGYGRPIRFKFPRGAILNRDLNEVQPMNPKDRGDQGVHRTLLVQLRRTETRP